MAYAELLPRGTVSTTWNSTPVTPDQHTCVDKTGETPDTAEFVNCGQDGKVVLLSFDGTELLNSNRISSLKPRLYLEGVDGTEIPALRVEVFVGGGLVGQFTSACSTGLGTFAWFSFELPKDILAVIFASSSVQMLITSLDGDAGYPHWNEA